MATGVDFKRVLTKTVDALRTAEQRYRRHSPTEKLPTSVVEILADEDASATGVYLATTKAIGSSVLVWEPESIWMELRDFGVEVGLENRDKLMAVVTCVRTRGAFYWDALLYEKTALAFNNIPIVPDGIQEASPGELSWAVYEAEALSRFGEFGQDYDYEPQKYTAVSLYRAGFVLAPNFLVFAQSELDKLNRGNQEIKEEVAARWSDMAVDDENLESLELTEDAVDVQVGLLAANRLYMHKRLSILEKDIDKL